MRFVYQYTHDDDAPRRARCPGAVGRIYVADVRTYASSTADYTAVADPSPGHGLYTRAYTRAPHVGATEYMMQNTDTGQLRYARTRAVRARNDGAC